MAKLLLPAPRPDDVFLVVGKRGKGKSTFAKRSMARWRVPILVWDPHDEYSRGGRAADGVELGPLRNRVDVGELFAHPELLDDPELSLAVVPPRDPEEFAPDFDLLGELVLDTGGLTFLVDEVYLTSARCQRTYGILGTQSRHSGVALVLVSQRAVSIPPDCRSQASAVAAFRQDHPADLDALADVYGARGRELAEHVGQLEPRQCLVWFDDDRQREFPLPVAPTLERKRRT